MGHVLSASCRCGYQLDDVVIGGGQSDFTTTCMHPGLCESGKHLISVNLKNNKSCCPDHVGDVRLYFNDDRLQQTPGLDVVSSWQGRDINNGTYLCPKCMTYGLAFSRPHTYFD